MRFQVVRICKQCEKTKPLEDFSYSRRQSSNSRRWTCRSCVSALALAATHRKQKADPEWAEKERVRKRQAYERRIAADPTYFTEKAKANRNKLRLKAFRYYSSDNGIACACCGVADIRFLTLDHVNSDGARHREEIGEGRIWWWLRENNYPPGFQILCYSCNSGRFLNGGVCPHKQSSGRIFIPR